MKRFKRLVIGGVESKVLALDAEQFDDLTMLCLEYKGNNSKKKG